MTEIHNLGNVTAAEKVVLYNDFGQPVCTCINTTNSIAYAANKTGAIIGQYKIMGVPYSVEMSELRAAKNQPILFKNDNDAYFHQSTKMISNMGTTLATYKEQD